MGREEEHIEITEEIKKRIEELNNAAIEYADYIKKTGGRARLNDYCIGQPENTLTDDAIEPDFPNEMHIKPRGK